MTKRGRPRTGKQGEHLNLWMEKTIKRKLSKLANEDKKSQSAFVESLVEAAWSRRAAA